MLGSRAFPGTGRPGHLKRDPARRLIYRECINVSAKLNFYTNNTFAFYTRGTERDLSLPRTASFGVVFFVRKRHLTSLAYLGQSFRELSCHFVLIVRM